MDLKVLNKFQRSKIFGSHLLLENINLNAFIGQHVAHIMNLCNNYLFYEDIVYVPKPKK